MKIPIRQRAPPTDLAKATTSISAMPSAAARRLCTDVGRRRPAKGVRGRQNQVQVDDGASGMRGFKQPAQREEQNEGEGALIAVSITHKRAWCPVNSVRAEAEGHRP